MKRTVVICFVMISISFFQINADDCTGYFFENSSKLFKNKDGKDVVTIIPQGAFALPYPTEDILGIGFNQPRPVANSICLAYRMFYIRGCACDPQSLSSSDGFLRAMYLIDGEWTSGWVRNTEAVPFRYKPDISFQDFGKASMLNTASVLKGIALWKDELRNKNFKPPEIQSQFSFKIGKDTLWTGVVEALAENNIPIEIIDKNSGLLTTKPIPDPKGNTMVCPTAFSESYMVQFNVFVKTKGDSSVLRINTRFSAERDGKAMSCFSNGVLEEWLSSRVSALTSN